MQEKYANFVASQNPSCYTNEHDMLTLPHTKFLRESFILSYSHYLRTCLLTRILTYLFNYLLTHSHTHLVKYIHTRFKFNIEAYQDITIYYIALSL